MIQDDGRCPGALHVGCDLPETSTTTTSTSTLTSTTTTISTTSSDAGSLNAKIPYIMMIGYFLAKMLL